MRGSGVSAGATSLVAGADGAVKQMVPIEAQQFLHQEGRGRPGRRPPSAIPLPLAYDHGSRVD